MDNEETCTTEESKEIKPIGKDTVHRICSGQVVLSLAIAMKELVENSIDAGATIIDIHLTEYGSESLEVSDNGTGVHKDNFQALTLKHYTSKIKEFDDLTYLGTLGFRGEALSSLCALSDVEITSKHHSTDLATKLSYDYGGNIIGEETVARPQGTTVSLKNLFATLPVRKKEFTKNLKKEFMKMCNLLYAYCLLPSGIKYTCTNTTNKGSKSTVVTTEGQKTVRENIISVFGVKQLASLVEVNLVPPNEKVIEEYKLNLTPGDELPFTIDFLISSVVHGSGRSATDRQFFYINQRPCEPSKVTKLINEVYRQFNGKQYPFVYLNITTKSCLVDVNITPDKRQVFLEQEKLLLGSIKTSLLEVFKDFPSTLPMQKLDVSQRLSLKRHLTDGSVQSSSILESFKKRSKSDESNLETFRKTTKSEQDSILERFKKRSESDRSILETFRKTTTISEQDITDSQIEADKKLDMLVQIACRLTKEDESIVEETTIDYPQEIHPKRLEITLNLNFESLKDRFKTDKQSNQASKNTVKFRSDLAPEANKTAEEELDRHISKKDFHDMEIIGQFNLGFIITKLLDDLFIIDQHATDEKYNFEQLQLNTIIDSQKLVSPKLLELTAAAKTTLIEHEEVFKKNGFSFNKEDDKIYLTSVPMSDRTIFGKGDIDEMIFMLQEDPSQDGTCRPSRIRSMFASRACRKSVMIGKSLSRTDMRKLVDHMGQIEQPWNCPHGRPTMRHLVNLSLLSKS